MSSELLRALLNDIERGCGRDAANGVRQVLKDNYQGSKLDWFKKLSEAEQLFLLKSYGAKSVWLGERLNLRYIYLEDLPKLVASSHDYLLGIGEFIPEKFFYSVTHGDFYTEDDGSPAAMQFLRHFKRHILGELHMLYGPADW